MTCNVGILVFVYVVVTCNMRVSFLLKPVVKYSHSFLRSDVSIIMDFVDPALQQSAISLIRCNMKFSWLPLFLFGFLFYTDPGRYLSI